MSIPDATEKRGFASPLTTLLRITLITAPHWLNDFYSIYLPENAHTLRLILDIQFYILWEGSLIFLAWRAGWFRFADIYRPDPFWLRDLLAGVALFFALLIAIVGLQYLLIRIKPHLPFHSYVNGHPPLPDWGEGKVFLYILYLSVTAGIFEEFIYRGLVINQLEKAGFRTGARIGISVFLFILIHWSTGPKIWALALVMGLLWVILYEWKRRLLPLIVSHAMLDFFLFYGFQHDLYERLGIG